MVTTPTTYHEAIKLARAFYRAGEGLLYDLVDKDLLWRDWASKAGYFRLTGQRKIALSWLREMRRYVQDYYAAGASITPERARHILKNIGEYGAIPRAFAREPYERAMPGGLTLHEYRALLRMPCHSLYSALCEAARPTF